MRSYVCSVCGYIYDEARGIPENGIAPGTLWENLPDGWVCPLCKADKSAFREKTAAPAAAVIPAEAPEFEKELIPAEVSVICSNLARGCEKEYLAEESENFRKLAEFFDGKTEKPSHASSEALLELIEKDLSSGFPYANSVCAKDRGALRSLVWSEKVTRMLQSLLERYVREGDRMLENTGVWVCTVCGFVSVGDRPPELCPVCKVPGWKFEKVQGRVL